MTEQVKQWFDALTKDRTDSARTLEKPHMRGVQRSVVDKYSDQAHFIYELLQNADDAKATSAHFRLSNDGLYFIHNGTVRFTVSNPHSEEIDTKNGVLGHVNSITSIANSNKPEASIGKFGVGFKAVFQYTQTPHIYDPGIRFKIEHFIVPHLLNTDLHWRGTMETVFWFPFNHKDKTPEESFEDILEKLMSLDFPILFLSHLKLVTFEGSDIIGKYSKEIEESKQLGDITVQRMALTFDSNVKQESHHLLTFAKVGVSGLPYCIGYALGADRKIVPITRRAFCFFPTKEVTNLNFVIHAPFLLTDSREGIKAGEGHNKNLIQNLSLLAADSLPILRDVGLIDDGILEIIPYDEEKFSELDDRTKISFKPFYTAFESKLQTDSLLPAANGACSPKHRSYWASDTQLVELFSDNQLTQLTGTKNARWVFRSRGKKEVQSANRALADYIDGGDAREWMFRESHLIITSLDPKDVLKRISSQFIAAQPYEWLHKFYLYLSERDSYQQLVKGIPIFLDQNRNAVPAFDGNGQLVLFFPDDEISGYTTVNSQLLSEKSTIDFIGKFGVKKPSLRDEIYNKILPAYETETHIDTAPHFAKFFRYFKECRNEEVAEFIKLIQNKEFLLYKTLGNINIFREMAKNIYYPLPDLAAWFETKPDTKFLLLEKYKEMVAEKDHKRLEEFFERLGIMKTPIILSRDIDRQVLGGQQLSLRGRNHRYIDKYLDGCEQLISNINESKSILLWHVLVNLVNLQGLFGLHTWFHHKAKFEDFKSTEVLRLSKAKWILNNSGEFVSSDEITIQSLSDMYDTTSPSAIALLNFLGIHDTVQGTSHLSEEDARKIRLANKIEQLGLSEEEVLAAIEDAKRKKQDSHQSEKSVNGIDSDSSESPLIREIESRRPSARDYNSPSPPRNPTVLPSSEYEDADDYTPKTVDFGKKLDRAKDRYASELDHLEREQGLHEKANSLPIYSYGWFLALLELECITSSEKNADGKTVSISFGKVERDIQSSRTIVLKEPSRFIPPSIEEFSGVRVDLDFGNGRTDKLRVDSFTAKEFSLLGKLDSETELFGIDLDKVLEARIEVQNPSFLLQELLERFRELHLDEMYDMKANLTPEIEFVFGPPGTGKTTHLAEKVLIPRMSHAGNERILVLTPTNKAADVLTTRIMEKMGGDTTYLNWLIRFGTSSDERIEKAGVWRDRSFEIGALSRSVTVTTIARFAYDGFTGEHGRKLHKIKWDTIVFDEASMISLASIIHPLYQQNPNKFIVAGDPFQIEPIVSVENWKDMNIYSLVGLNQAGSFAKPATEPHDYLVRNLETQFRSIPSIGEVFSRFTYDGVLKHHRDVGSQRPLGLTDFDAKPINIIKFPVSKYESIYRARRLESGTPYQTYSALFTFEFVCWLAGQIQGNHANKFRIGIIAPYRAQANLLNRLNDSWAAKPDSVEIQVGTIHGFQGDECDIIIAVFNPPPNISSDSRMFLNKQNILNVAISRARDYLFIVMPNHSTKGFEKLHKIARIEELINFGGDFSEHVSSAIEEKIWGNANYLEENTFSTGHQMVNIYRKPERYYEVRSDDTAIDVQIHEKDQTGY